MHDPSHALQKALVARLKAGVPLVSGRVFDRVPMSAVFPFIQIGHTQAVNDDATCIDGATCYVTLHVWSRAVGAVEARRVADQIAAALQDWVPDLAADGFAFADGRLNSVQTTGDPDGITTHSILTFEAQTERM